MDRPVHRWGHVSGSRLFRAAGCLLSLVPLTLTLAPGAAVAEAFPAPLRFEAFGIADGLSQGSITALVEDQRGFLWVGTLDGLNRFDGYEFRRYRPDPTDPAAIEDGSIAALAMHPDGTLWIGTMHGGLAHYDPAQDVFRRIPSDADLDANRYRITSLAVDALGTLWVGTRGGLGRVVEGAGGQVTLVRSDDRHVESLLAAEERIWVGRRDGTLEAFTAGHGTDAERSLVPFPDRAPVRAIVSDARGALWIASDGASFARIEPASGAITYRGSVDPPGSGESPRLRALLVDDEDRLWLAGLATGVVVLDPASNQLDSIRHRPFDPYGLANDDVISLCRDRSGTLWVGALSGGLHRLRLPTAGFRHFWHRPGDPQALGHNTVTSFAEEPDGSLWVGTDGGGLYRQDPLTGSFEAHALPRGPAAGSTRVWSLQADRAGALWVGTWGAGLYRRAPGDPVFRPVDELPARVVTALADDGDTLWVGSNDAGLARLSRDGRLLSRYLDRRNVASLAVSGGVVWVGMWSEGLIRLDTATGGITQYVHRPGDPTSLPHNSVRGVWIGEDGAPWLATGAGLARLRPAGEAFEPMGTEGLPTGVLYGIETDRDGRLWISSNDGLARFDRETGAVRRFGPDDGLQDYEFNGGAHLRLADGRLAFGGVNGFNIVEPARVGRPTPPARVELVELRIATRPALPRSRDPRSPLDKAAPELQSLVLGHRENALAFRFALPLSVAPSQVRYQYRLDGFDEDWRETPASQRIAAYMNLPPGRYVFRLRAADADGAWSTADREISLRIRPPWWASRWAYAVYASLALLAVFAVIQWRTQALHQRADMLARQVEQRTRQLRTQTALIEQQAGQLQHALETKERLFARVSHEFRTPLTLILGPIESLLADERRGRVGAWLRVMRRNARRLLALVDQLLGLAQVSGQAPVQPTSQHVTPLVRGTVAAFDSVAVRRGVALTLGHVDEAWALATPETLERIVTNLVSNAVKYTEPGGHVTVSLTADSQWVALEVRDDGPGIPAEEHEAIFEPFHRVGGHGQGTGLGLALVRECATALGGSVTLDSAPGRGSTFTVRLAASPAGLEHADDDAQTERMLLEAEAVAPSARDDTPVPIDASADPADDTERPRVLLVEDNADLRGLLVATLAPHYRCQTADDGLRGIAIALEDPPELVVSDVMMPGADGFEVVRSLKRDERSSHVPIVLLTALGDRESRLHGLEEHADDYLVKPFDPDELLLRVRNLIEARRVAAQRAARLLETAAAPEAAAEMPLAVVHSPREQAFLARLEAAATKGYADTEFSVADLAAQVAMSERQLQRKVRALLGISPADYLREVRLRRAAELLRAGHSATRVAMDTGFASASHFGALFKARFGQTPGEYSAGRR
jgi:signal transduction histidine kinase/ligand-binding sensor domain-containing protein/DNA-binding response OmpR family regulator